MRYGFFDDSRREYVIWNDCLNLNTFPSTPGESFQTTVARDGKTAESVFIAGRDAPTHVEAKNSWLGGTAAWKTVAISQWILGIRPTFDGLQIAPAVPNDWPGFESTRIFRGVTYGISVERVGSGNGVALSVDGRAIEDNVVPLPPEGQSTVIVKVALGQAGD